MEKTFKNNLGLEACFVQGQFNYFLETDHYDYNGVLLRLKKYFVTPEYGEINPYAAVYAGTLQRNIKTAGYVNNSGYYTLPSRDFSSNSLRGGGSAGFLYITKTKFVVDAQSSLGYGRYINLDKNDRDTRWKGYLDVQLWLSLGYCF